MADATPAEPSALEVVSMLAVACVIHLFIFSHAVDYWTTVSSAWVNNDDYLRIASAIQRGPWECTPECAAHGWGFPAVIAAVAGIFRTSNVFALIAVSLSASLLASVLIRRLYGGWVAAAFVAVGHKWIQLSTGGGSETLFVCLIYGTFIASRAGRFRTASLLALLVTTVRHVGLFAVAALAVDMLRRRDWVQLLNLGGIAAAVITVYLAGVAAIAGSPLVLIQGYREEWYARLPVTIPFVTLLMGSNRFLVYPLETLLTYGWIAAAAAAVFVLWRGNWPESQNPERLFAVGYLLFFLSCTYDGIVDWFLRLIIPAAPIIVYALSRWIPRKRWVLWSMCCVSGILGAGVTLLWH